MIWRSIKHAFEFETSARNYDVEDKKMVIECMPLNLFFSTKALQVGQSSSYICIILQDIQTLNHANSNSILIKQNSVVLNCLAEQLET